MLNYLVLRNILRERERERERERPYFILRRKSFDVRENYFKIYFFFNMNNYIKYSRIFREIALEKTVPVFTAKYKSFGKKLTSFT